VSYFDDEGTAELGNVTPNNLPESLIVDLEEDRFDSLLNSHWGALIFLVFATCFLLFLADSRLWAIRGTND